MNDENHKEYRRLYHRQAFPIDDTLTSLIKGVQTTPWTIFIIAALLFIAAYLYGQICPFCPLPYGEARPTIHSKPEIQSHPTWPDRTQILLKWKSHPHAQYSMIEYQVKSDPTWTPLGTLNSHDYVFHRNVIPGETYIYRVRTVFRNRLKTHWSDWYTVTADGMETIPKPTATPIPSAADEPPSLAPSQPPPNDPPPTPQKIRLDMDPRDTRSTKTLTRKFQTVTQGETHMAKPPIDLEMIGIPIGAKLTHTDYPDKHCIVIRLKGHPLVVYNYEILSLSLAAAKASGAKNSGGIAGPLYWMYEGESLQRRRARFEEYHRQT